MRTALLFALLCAAPAVLAQDAATRNLASACAICHGTGGTPATNTVVPLNGLPRQHIADQMRAFRDGKRPATVMHQIAKGYTDPQIDALAGWFAAQKK